MVLIAIMEVITVESPEVIKKKKAFVGLYAEYSKKRLFSCLPDVASSKNNCAGPFIDIDEIPFAI